MRHYLSTLTNTHTHGIHAEGENTRARSRSEPNEGDIKAENAAALFTVVLLGVCLLVLMAPVACGMALGFLA